MANFRAIRATCDGVVALLKQSAHPKLFNNMELEFDVYRAENFDNPMSVGVSLFPYHVSINAVQRTLPGRIDLKTRKQHRPQLPLDVHFILTPWAQDASLTLDILGWMMRTLEDHPTIGSSVLDPSGSIDFTDDEIVEIVAEPMTNEELFRIWDALPGDFRLSVPYVARVVRIDSPYEVGGGIVLERDLRFGRAKQP
jgi:hypothetical protein